MQHLLPNTRVSITCVPSGTAWTFYSGNWEAFIRAICKWGIKNKKIIVDSSIVLKTNLLKDSILIILTIKSDNHWSGKVLASTAMTVVLQYINKCINIVYLQLYSGICQIYFNLKTVKKKMYA